MGAGEIVELAFATLLVGLLVGVWIGVSVQRGRRQHLQRRREQMEACARWLAARRSLSRASRSLVAAFRYLAAAPPGAANHGLRQHEAQRARAFWCESMRELDQAETTLIVRGFLMDDGQPWAAVDRVDARALQVAINGTAAEVDQLIRSLDATDRHAYIAVQAAVERLDRRLPSIVSQSARNLQSWIKRIVNGWSQA